MSATETIYSQRADASQAAFTDNSGGVAADTIPVGASYRLHTFRHALADLANSQEYKYDAGHAGKLVAINARVVKAVTTGAKAATVTGRVNAGALGGGGVVSLTSANCANIGDQVAGSAITGANSFTAAQTFGYAISGVTAFAEGEVVVECLIMNTDLAAFIAAMADKWNETRTWFYERGLWKGSA